MDVLPSKLVNEVHPLLDQGQVHGSTECETSIEAKLFLIGAALDIDLLRKVPHGHLQILCPFEKLGVFVRESDLFTTKSSV